jgi:hypothetical protein
MRYRGSPARNPDSILAGGLVRAGACRGERATQIRVYLAGLAR